MVLCEHQDTPVHFPEGCFISESSLQEDNTQYIEVLHTLFI